MRGSVLRGRSTTRIASKYKLAQEYNNATVFSPLNGLITRNIAKYLSLTSATLPVGVNRQGRPTVSFTGTGTYLKTSGNIGTPAVFTLCAWVRPSALNTSYTRILETDYSVGLYLGSNTGSQYTFIVNDSAYEACAAGQQVVGQFDCLHATFDGTNRNLYINGKLAGQASATALNTSYDLPLFIGAAAGGTSYGWQGDIDSVGFFPRAFSAGEIRNLYEDSKRYYAKKPVRRLYLVPAASGINLTIADTTIVNPSAALAITQTHILAVASSTQSNPSATGAVTQTQVLAGAASAQDNAGSTGTITVGSSVILIGAASTQANAGDTGAITQTHVLTASACAQDGTSSAVAITQVHALTGANGTQANPSGTGAISVSTGNLVGAPSTQINLSGSGAITQIGAVPDAWLAAQIDTSSGIKKPGIPATAPDWLRILLEIIIGRRGNKIAIPSSQTLTFSTTPTKSECEALYSYTNEVRSAVENIINRLDG